LVRSSKSHKTSLLLHNLPLYLFKSKPLIVNPQKHIEEAEIDEIHIRFEKARGDKKEGGPAMFIVAPYDKVDEEEFDDENSSTTLNSRNSTWMPSTNSPEWVVAGRAVALAKRSYQFLMARQADFDQSMGWFPIFQESLTSFHAYNVLLRVSPDFIVDHETSSSGVDLSPSRSKDEAVESSYTRSMKSRLEGPKALRRKVYKNLHTSNDPNHVMLLSWDPIESLLSSLRKNFGLYALFFYNELSPEVIGLVWRPDAFKAMSFSAMTAEYAMPQDPDANGWRNDSLVVRNSSDLLREMSEYYDGIVTKVKILDHSLQASKKRRRTESL
jgi:hypothetical protein